MSYPSRPSSDDKSGHVINPDRVPEDRDRLQGGLLELPLLGDPLVPRRRLGPDRVAGPFGVEADREPGRFLREVRVDLGIRRDLQSRLEADPLVSDGLARLLGGQSDLPQATRARCEAGNGTPRFATTSAGESSSTTTRSHMESSGFALRQASAAFWSNSIRNRPWYSLPSSRSARANDHVSCARERDGWCALSRTVSSISVRGAPASTWGTGSLPLSAGSSVTRLIRRGSMLGVTAYLGTLNQVLVTRSLALPYRLDYESRA